MAEDGSQPNRPVVIVIARKVFTRWYVYIYSSLRYASCSQNPETVTRIKTSSAFTARIHCVQQTLNTPEHRAFRVIDYLPPPPL
jgi:hypothetical protein